MVCINAHTAVSPIDFDLFQWKPWYKYHKLIMGDISSVASTLNTGLDNIGLAALRPKSSWSGEYNTIFEVSDRGVTANLTNSCLSTFGSTYNLPIVSQGNIVFDGSTTIGNFYCNNCTLTWPTRTKKVFSVYGSLVIADDILQISSHGFITGQPVGYDWGTTGTTKLLYHNGTVYADLLNRRLYYIIRVDNNKFKLASSEYNATVVAASPTFTSGSGNGIVVSSATGIAIGQTVEGDFIASDTYVYGISGTIITLSKSISYVPVAGTSIRFRGISMNLNAAATAATNAYFDTTMYSPENGTGGEQGTYGVYATTVGDTVLNVDPTQDNPLGTGGTIGLYVGMYLGLNLNLGLFSGLSPDGMTWLGPISAVTGTGITLAGNGCPTIVGSATEYATCFSYMNTTKRTYAILTLNSEPEGTLYPNQLVYMSGIVGGEPCRVISVTGKGIGTKVLLQIPEQNWWYNYGIYRSWYVANDTVVIVYECDN